MNVVLDLLMDLTTIGYFGNRHDKIKNWD